jgi:hypothetical protein
MRQDSVPEHLRLVFITIELIARDVFFDPV